MNSIKFLQTYSSLDELNLVEPEELRDQIEFQLKETFKETFGKHPEVSLYDHAASLYFHAANLSLLKPLMLKFLNEIRQDLHEQLSEMPWDYPGTIVDYVDGDFQKRMLKELYWSWDKFSGDTYYPIYSNDQCCCAAEEFHETRDLWHGSYGRHHHELLQHLLNETYSSMKPEPEAAINKLERLALRYQIRQEYEQQYEPVIAQLIQAQARIKELEEVRDDLLKEFDFMQGQCEELKTLKHHLKFLSES